MIDRIPAEVSSYLQMCPLPAFVMQKSIILDCNAAMVNWIGRQKTDIVSVHPASLSVQQQASTPSERLFNTKLRRGEDKPSFVFEWEFLSASGRVLPCEIAVHNGPSKLTIATVQDNSKMVEEQEKLMRSLGRYGLLFDAGPDPYWILSRNTFVDCNEAAVKHMGYPDKASLLNKHPSELSPATQPNGESSFLMANLMGRLAWKRGMYRFEWVHKRANGEEFTADVVLKPLELGEHIVTLCTWRDISDRKKRESKLLSKIADMESRMKDPPSSAE